jgi:Asp/Glu/hydantoin racemase
MAPDTPVMGVENGRELFRVLVTQDKAELDVAAAQQDILDAGRALVAAHPEVGAIVLECTNMPPYAAALQAELGLPVHDVISLGTYLFGGLRPRRW